MRGLLLIGLVLAAGCEKKGTGGTEPAAPVTTSAKKVDPGPKPQGVADDWTHKELAEYLGTKGVKVTVSPTPALSRPGSPAAWLHGDGDRKPEVVAYLCPTANAAREQAGSMGEGAFFWGRFALGVTAIAKDQDRDLLRRVRAALE